MPPRGTFPFERFISNLRDAADRARVFAEEFTLLQLPVRYAFDVGGAAITAEDQKALGGRRDDPKQYLAVTLERAGKLLWVDGAVPFWINISVDSYSDDMTFFEILFCHDLVTPEKFPRVDFNEPRFPFRIRGPALPAEEDFVRPVPLKRRAEVSSP
jgi:hypothetical protein